MHQIGSSGSGLGGYQAAKRVPDQRRGLSDDLNDECDDVGCVVSGVVRLIRTPARLAVTAHINREDLYRAACDRLKYKVIDHLGVGGTATRQTVQKHHRLRIDMTVAIERKRLAG